PLSVPLNRPCAFGFLTTCGGTSCPDDSAAVQTVVRPAGDASATTPKATRVISEATSFLIVLLLEAVLMPLPSGAHPSTSDRLPVPLELICPFATVSVVDGNVSSPLPCCRWPVGALLLGWARDAPA